MKKRPTPTLRVLRLLAGALFATLLASPTVLCQCQLDWQPGTPMPGPSGRVTALGNLPNGDLVAAGWFLEAGAITANRVARWDGSQWHAFGAGVNNAVFDMVIAPNGDVYVAGEFTSAGGVPANRVARWDGSSWSALGQGLDGIVTCLELLPNGDLLAGGGFRASGSTSTRMLARWDGASWSQVGSGLVGANVRSITALPGGGFAVCGWIDFAGGLPVARIAIWDGANWSGIPGLQSSAVTRVAVAANGDLAMAGSFLLSGGGTATIVTWDGTTVQGVAGGVTPNGPGGGRHLSSASNGDLVVVTNTVWRWDGVGWTSLGGEIGIETFALLERPNGEWLVGGGRNQQLTPYARSLQLFDGTSWQDLSAPALVVRAFDASSAGELYAGLVSAEGDSAVQRWNGAQWQPVGPAIEGVASDITVVEGGDLLVSGFFPAQTGGGSEPLLRWDGLQWTPIWNWLPGSPSVVAASPDATLFAGLSNLNGPAVVSFDGNQWSEVGTGVTGRVFGLAFFANGDLVVGVYPSSASQSATCLRWDGVSWSAFGPDLPALPDVARKLVARADGRVVVSMEIPNVGGRVLVGDGSSWTQLGGVFDNLVDDLVTMPSGDVVAAGRFEQIGGAAIAGLARWDGSAWSAVADAANGPISRVGVTGNGELHVAGEFTRLGTQLSAGIGRAVTSCPANSASYGNGCLGPAGPVVLAALDSPWVGANYRVRAYGMPANSVAVHATGLAQATVALPPLLPQSLPGCQLLTSAEVLGLALPNGGIAEPRLQLPNDVALVGRTFYQQVLAVQIGVGGDLLTVSSSNGLAATIGAF